MKFCDGNSAYLLTINYGAWHLDRATIDQIIADSGLFGLTVYTNEAGNSVLEFYYYGKPTDTDAINEFNNAASRAAKSASAYAPRVNAKIHRAWFYSQPDIAASWGAGFTIPYTSVSSGLYTQPKNQPNAVVSAVAQSLNPTARGFEQKNITKKQFKLGIAIVCFGNFAMTSVF